MLALTAQIRRWEPKKLRLRLFAAAAQLVTTGRRRRLRFTTRWPWTDETTRATDRLNALRAPGLTSHTDRSNDPHHHTGKVELRPPDATTWLSTCPSHENHLANVESPSVHRRGLMNDRG